MTDDQPGHLDRAAALAMWREYAVTLPGPPPEEPAVDRLGLIIVEWLPDTPVGAATRR